MEGPPGSRVLRWPSRVTARRCPSNPPPYLLLEHWVALILLAILIDINGGAIRVDVEQRSVARLGAVAEQRHEPSCSHPMNLVTVPRRYSALYRGCAKMSESLQ